MTTDTRTPRSGLTWLLQSIAPPGRYDAARQTMVYPLASDTIAAIGERAENSATSLTLGLGIVGRMLTLDEVSRELSPHELASLGDLIATLSEATHELNEIARWASDAEPDAAMK